MSVTTSHPGVYIVEIPSGSRTITGVATSTAAFVGRALCGPVNDPVPIASFADFERTFGGLWRGSGLGYAVRDLYLNGGGDALIVRVVHTGDTDPDENGTAATLDVDGLALTASGPGAWANALTVDVTHPSGQDAADIADAQRVKPDDLFNLTVGGNTVGPPPETFLNVTVVDGPRQVDVVLAASRLVAVTGALPGDRPGTGPYTVVSTAQGRDGAAPGETDIVGSADDKTGMNALVKADLFNILCIPPPTPTTDVPDPVWSAAAGFCRDHRAFLIVDPPAARTAANVDDWVSGPASLTGVSMRNAALYFPRIRRPDPLRGGATGDFAACGSIAGTYARTDGSRGVWKAPAGIEAGLSGVSSLTAPIVDSENGDLNELGINCLRTFRGIGTVIWGARTLRGADVLTDEYKYIPVRRLALFLEETLYRNTQWVVFEPNDEPLWGQIRASIGAFMQDLFRRAAFQGSTPREAYFVRCDADTTTQYDIDRGIVNIQVGFAPLKPAEFVVISIQQKTASASA
jgi:uncharacterized protein